MKKRAERICVIGAGPSGITAAKNLLDQGFDNLVIYDRGSRVGGNWVFDRHSGHSSVFETTHIISSKKYSQYDDYPMPESYPDYPGHAHLAAYFEGYAEHFGLYDYISFQTMVENCVRNEDETWDVTICRNGERTTEHFDTLFVCNGHHWKPRHPEYSGEYTGEWLHSHDFKSSEPFRGKRVLVIGGGNSACDVAVETSRVSAETHISWRRGYYVVPKFIFGQPGDHLHNQSFRYTRFIPKSLRWKSFEWLLRLINGKNESYGLPKPDHAFGATHPTINSELLYFIRHGEIKGRVDIDRFEGKTVHFKDGSSGEFDTIIACTGYEICHPFFDSSFIDYSTGPVPLYLRMIHGEYRNLYFIGLFQPLGCIWPAAELQSKIAARELAGLWQRPKDTHKAIEHELAHPDLDQVSSPRHTITVDYPAFRKRLLMQLPKDYISREPIKMMQEDKKRDPAGVS